MTTEFMKPETKTRKPPSASLNPIVGHIDAGSILADLRTQERECRWCAKKTSIKGSHKWLVWYAKADAYRHAQQIVRCRLPNTKLTDWRGERA